MNDEYWRRFRILEKRGQLLMMDFIRGLPESEYQSLKSDALKTIIEMRGNPYHAADGKFTTGGAGKKTKLSSRQRVKMSKTEFSRVSSGILTDHPNLQIGEHSNYFHNKHYYEYDVISPGSYRFTMKIALEGNQEYINRLQSRKRG